MAYAGENYPFRINIINKEGNKRAYFTSSFATDLDTVVSCSIMVNRINNMYSSSYRQDASGSDQNFSGLIDSISGGGNVSIGHGSHRFSYHNDSDIRSNRYLSASFAHSDTGSVVFTDIESTEDGGLDYYEFYGTKVCSVLGVPEGIPIYTENFKFSDSSTDTTNYMSGDVISDSIQIKEGFKMSSQARMKSNLLWDDLFGEGYVQWVSGSTTKMLMGYNPVTDVYNVNAPQITGSAIKATTFTGALTGNATTATFATNLNGGGVTLGEGFVIQSRVGNETGAGHKLILSASLNQFDNGGDIILQGGHNAGGAVADSTNVRGGHVVVRPGRTNLDVPLLGTEVASSPGTRTSGSFIVSGSSTFTGNINVNGNIVGDDATDITNIESISVDNVRADADSANNYINLADNDISITVNAKEMASFEDNQIIFNEGGNDVDVRMEVLSSTSTTGMEDLDFAFHLDAGKGIASFGDGAEDNFRGRVLQVHANKENAYALWVQNEGDNANRQGLAIQCGADSGTGTLINLMDGSGDSVGTITFSGGTVTYGTFTGVHDAYIMESDGVAENLPSSSLELYYESGTIVSMVSSSKDNSFQPINFVVSSSTYQDKRAYGVYMGSYEWSDRDSDYHAEFIDKHLIASIGDGYVFVNNQGGDIEIGDYITTASGSGGYGCKQNDDLLHNYTVAKATDGVTWSNESTTYKLLACTYHCG